MVMEKLYTVKETAEYLRKAVQTIRHYMSNGTLTYISGRPAVIPESAIKAFLERRKKRAII